MPRHPILKSIWCILLGILSVLLLVLTHWLLLVLYTNVSEIIALIDSLLYIIPLCAIGYFYWYVTAYSQAIQTKIIIALFIQIICLVNNAILLDYFKIELFDESLLLIPLRLAIGLPAWVILLQWYNITNEKQQLFEKCTEEVKENESIGNDINKSDNVAGAFIDRISVKDNSQIHIIKVEELLYIQSYGDYVWLYTDKNKYLKEQTMKYLELNLPASFVRIHRSYIVNSDCIVRVELFGKETYQVRLKNGIYLKVSSSGYRVLKDRLLL